MIFGLLAGFAFAQTEKPVSPPITLKRTYELGAHVAYQMTGLNEDRKAKRRYTARADGVVIKNSSGVFVEDFAWSKVAWDGKPVELPPDSQSFREGLSLDPKWNPGIPNLSRVSPKLIGPITDLLTFYVDVYLPMRIGIFKKEGDHMRIPVGKASSWADGSHVIVGEDSIDFDISLEKIDRGRSEATLIVHHVPPKKSILNLQADWMKTPVKDTPNNWVEVTKTDSGKFEAAVGKETFDVTIMVDLQNGAIKAATLENVVDVVERECSDSTLSTPGPANQYRIHRRIVIRAVN